MKKKLSLFLSIVMLVSMLSGINLGANAAIYSGSCGTNLTWNLNTSTGEFTVTGKGTMADFPYESAPWYSRRSDIKTVTIGNGVTAIGSWAFSECSNLTSVTLPNSMTAIGDVSFNGCSKLAGITIPNSMTSIGGWAFYGCNKLKSVTIPKSVTVIGESAFIGCESLTSINVNSSNTAYSSQDGVLYNKAKTTLIQYPCGKTGTFAIPNSVTTIGQFAFVFCPLTSLTISNNVKKIGVLAFQDSKSLTIYGYSGSYAQKYAKDNNVPFKVLKVTVTLSATSYTYDGKEKKPSVTVKDSKGKTLKNGTDYSVSNPSGRKNVGKYTVTITLKGNYSGTVKKTFTIKPKSTSISKLTATSKGFKLTWKKQATQTTGYEIQYSTSSNFSNAKIVSISKNGTTSRTVSKLTGKKKYFVRVRTYRTVSGTKIYSSWSGSKSVTTKK